MTFNLSVTVSQPGNITVTDNTTNTQQIIPPTNLSGAIAVEKTVLDTPLFGAIAGLGIDTDFDGDASNDLKIYSGFFTNSAGTKMFQHKTNMVKKINLPFEAGDGNGCKGVGLEKPSSGTIHLHAISNNITGILDFCWTDAIGTSSAIPSGWTWERRIGSFMTNSVSNLMRGQMTPDGTFTHVVGIKDYDTGDNYEGPGVPELIALSVPLGIKVQPLLLIRSQRVGVYTYLSSGDIEAENLGNMTIISESGGTGQYDNQRVAVGPCYRTDILGQIHFKVYGNPVFAQVFTLGWKDNR